MARKRLSDSIHDIPPELDGNDALSKREVRLQRLRNIVLPVDEKTGKPLAPRLWSPEKHLALIEYIEAGNFFSVACQRVGMSYKTFSAWMVRGGDPLSDNADTAWEPEEPYWTFAHDVREAEAASETILLESLQRAGRDDWKSHAYVLARKFPERWAEQKQQTNVGAGAGVTIILPDNTREPQVD